jgi:hypothetical protein
MADLSGPQVQHSADAGVDIRRIWRVCFHGGKSRSVTDRGVLLVTSQRRLRWPPYPGAGAR